MTLVLKTLVCIKVLSYENLKKKLMAILENF